MLSRIEILKILDLRATWYKNYNEDRKTNFHMLLSGYSKLLKKTFYQIINGDKNELFVYIIIDGIEIETGELDRC